MSKLPDLRFRETYPLRLLVEFKKHGMETSYTDEQAQQINGRRILITGGTTGIGRETAIRLSRLGANVLIAGLDEQHLNDALYELRQANHQGVINGVIADLATSEGIAKIFTEADALFGGKLDVLINNAALAYQSVREGTYTDWKRVIDTNLLAYIACTRMAIDRMTRVAIPHIIHIGSMSADVREPNSSVYVATKAGIQGFSESLRKEVTEMGIRVTLIEPGAADTDMQPENTAEKRKEVEQHSMLKAGDVASAIIYALTQNERCDVVEIRLRPRLQLI